MTATDELRRMLDERGVEWDYGIAGADTTRFNANGVDVTFTPMRDGLMCSTILTPEQAIAATLGSGTCKLDGFADVPFSIDYEIVGYDMGSGRDYATLAECSACGAYIIVPPEYHHVLTCDGDEVYQPYRFCPNCGRRVV